MKNIEEVLVWMKKQDWYSAFERAFEKTQKEERTYPISIEHFFNYYLKGGFEDIIPEAFNWDNSEEGHDFWREVDREYRQLLEKDMLEELAEIEKEWEKLDEYQQKDFMRRHLYVLDEEVQL